MALRLIALGHTNQQVVGKLGLAGRAALVRYALRHGLLEASE
jgi:DNA-binding CsgD family transcriptional regulator